MAFPITRLRRMRQSEVTRNMIRETRLTRDDLIMPLFVRPGKGIQNPINSMPGNYQLSVDLLVEKCKELYNKGVQSILLFGIPEHKDEHGLVACEHNGIVQQATRAIKKELPDLYIIADVCNCEYTTHGHCGTIINGDVDNDSTLITLGKQSVSLAEAGIDMIAPSDMMDGRIGFIRNELDKANFTNMPIMAYSAKYASAFYGPFRDAAESAPQFGNRATYQMDPANSNEALREVEQDIFEGADIVMVKPALSYLDVIRRVKDNFNMPIAAYNVSGEFSMVKAAAEKGWIDENRITLEILTSIKRAGSDLIISYHTQDVIDQL
ncbi:porphobilinogen synthase [Plebeiibacterium sediminum]|uniref:Delta-aminolevulinic acid dehydratase n=1 Tax=Plebeiibacterium sediminum TaxID=2992112 RepID=A0AAE3SEP8_9BACT|nr:porphobilinogen synthase [Plebeiobacterium sediminum]MCW3785358.1 porphobilinogen synthase [Plebeiobacterium sediminum]